MLSVKDRQQLLAMARRTVKEHLGAEEAAPGLAETIVEDLLEERGAFVTLTRDGRLRGCIGTFRPNGSLWDTVQQMALSAAISDPRFPSVTAPEVELLEFEISALTPLTRIDDIAEIVVGTHGLYITKGFHGGVLLPQVAVEYGWDKTQFLEHTCQKAGLSPDAWKQPDVTIEIFSAEVFSESDLEGTRVSCA